MKHLPKHLRPRWRYLAVELETWPDAAFDRGDFQRHLWYAAGNLLGDPGSAAADLSVLDFERGRGRGEAVVRTRRDSVGAARAALACVDDVDGDPVGVRVTGVSGTVRACREKYLRQGGETPEERRVAFEGETRSAVVRDGGLVDVETDGSFAGATELDFE